MASTTTTTTTMTPAPAPSPQQQEAPLPLPLPPIRISRIAGRYLVFDIGDAMRLRRRHNVCGVFAGSIPQNPQQNVFLGLPMELMAEEAAVLAAGGFARVVDDAAFHRARLAALTEASVAAARRTREGGSGGRSGDGDVGGEEEEDGGGGNGSGIAAVREAGRTYLEDIKSERKKVEDEVVEQTRQMRLRKVHHLDKAKGKTEKPKPAPSASSLSESPAPHSDTQTATATIGGDGNDDDLFGAGSAADTPAKSRVPTTTNAALLDEPSRQTFNVTPTTSGALLQPLVLSPPPLQSTSPSSPHPTTTTTDETGAPSPSPPPPLPNNNPLYAHLHGKGYYMMPGLRFGCDYNVYPGDPLRFHSHFQATCFGWDEEIAVLDLVAGGRLGTNVKKGFLVGGAVVSAAEPGGEGGSGGGAQDVSNSTLPSPPRQQQEGEEVRVFCIEWAGM